MRLLTKPLTRKTYLGDGVYIALDTDRHLIVLTTENGMTPTATNTIVMAAEGVDAFYRFGKSLIEGNG